MAIAPWSRGRAKLHRRWDTPPVHARDRSCASLALFAWLLTLHPTAAGRAYAAYGGVYVVTALGWLWLVERQRPNRYDLLGSAIVLVGMAIITFAPRGATAHGP